ncbi:MAG: acyl-ACP--UDP-N-acetylglucosamine O-acyltransferase, partial [Bacteroidales bacterium]|nr:acyl-ACP--UDP-N-acetylglucosamine O-acyltransferase [Bacteroidales bacterium]
MISPSANIHPKAQIAESAVIDPFVSISEDVVIGENTHIHPNVVIFDGARIGDNVTIFPGAVISAVPQDLKYRGEKTTVKIGNGTIIREFVTINKGTAAKMQTIVGNNCLLMAYSHVAHDCILGNNIILANGVQLAGEVEVDNFAILGGGTLVHQFTRIGKHVMT